jgi:hypothetical protein
VCKSIGREEKVMIWLTDHVKDWVIGRELGCLKEKKEEENLREMFLEID